jgi:predicted RNA-binding protein with PIN domain
MSDDPPVVPPAGLRRYLGFTRLSSATLQAIARVVDGDDEFRDRVAGEVDEADVGRAGWLWLTRPEGYLDDLHKLEEDAAAVATAEAEGRQERDARRRLAATQSAADRAVAAARAQAQEIEDLRTELLDERTRLSDVEERLAAVDTELERVRAERARAVRELKEVETRLAERATELKQVKAQLRELEAERGRTGEAPEATDTGTGAGTGTAVSAQDGLAGGLPVPADDAGDRVVEEPPPTVAPATPAASAPVATPVPASAPELQVDPVALLRALRSAARGAAGLAEALSEIETVVGALRPADIEVIPAPAPGATGAAADRLGGPPARVGEAPGRGAPAPVRRVPLPLPGGLLDDSVEAAEHLLRTPGILLLVDGYNVTMTGWPELPVGEQRRRLLGALGEAAARTGAAVDVVFDGADVEPISAPHQVRQLVRVRFSPPHVEADDVLLDLLGQLPVARPVVVVSSDKRVRDGARRQGANLMHARQLVGLLRR